MDLRKAIQNLRIWKLFGLGAGAKGAIVCCLVFTVVVGTRSEGARGPFFIIRCVCLWSMYFSLRPGRELRNHFHARVPGLCMYVLARAHFLLSLVSSVRIQYTERKERDYLDGGRGELLRIESKVPVCILK